MPLPTRSSQHSRCVGFSGVSRPQILARCRACPMRVPCVLLRQARLKRAGALQTAALTAAAGQGCSRSAQIWSG